VTDIAANLRSVQARIADAALRASRDPTEVRLVAVTKTLSTDLVGAAYKLGLRHFGENRVEEAAGKVAVLPPDITWHMIGHIQSRKAKQVVQLMHCIHSVDSLRLAIQLDRLSLRRTSPLPVLLEINVSGEPSKSGLPAAQWSADPRERQSLFSAIEDLVALPHLKVEGLMTIAPIVSEAEQARPVFMSLRRLLDELRSRYPRSDWLHLSMGMTDDFEIAIEEGATMVRIGRAIFGHRPLTARVAPATSHWSRA